MWQRPQVFVVMAGCLLSSIVPVWSQSRLPDGNRQDTVEAFNSERHKPRREEWRNVAGKYVEFQTVVAKSDLCGVGVFGSEHSRKGEAGSRWGPRKRRRFHQRMACPDPRLASP